MEKQQKRGRGRPATGVQVAPVYCGLTPQEIELIDKKAQEEGRSRSAQVAYILRQWMQAQGGSERLA